MNREPNELDAIDAEPPRSRPRDRAVVVFLLFALAAALEIGMFLYLTL